MPNQSSVWEKEFSDNYQPSLFVKFIKAVEKYRGDVIAELLPTGGHLVDLACGDGDLIFKTSDKYQKLTGFDIAKNRIEKATRKLEKNPTSKIKFVVQDLNLGIPLKDSSVDVIGCEASLAYLTDINFCLSEVYRVLNKGGVFIVEVPNYAYLFRRIALLFGYLPKTSSFPGLDDGGALHYFSYLTLQQRLQNSGFKVIQITNSGVLAQVRSLFPSLLASDIIIKAQK